VRADNRRRRSDVGASSMERWYVAAAWLASTTSTVRRKR
jgi:hypothetical protein